MAQPVYIAQLAIFIILLQPALYVLWKHGRHGLLGWFYLQLFCIVRVIGAALTIHEEDTPGSSPTPGLILSSIGLSPLLLATAGVLHEARTYHSPRPNRKAEWFHVIHYHTLVSAALALVVVGIVYFESDKTTNATKALLKVGAALALLAWVVLVVWVVLSARSRYTDRNARTYREGNMLLQACHVVLPGIGLRVVYAVVTLVLEVDGTKSGFPTSLAAKVCMSVVPEMLVTLTLVVAGVLTRDVAKKSATPRDEQAYSGVGVKEGGQAA